MTDVVTALALVGAAVTALSLLPELLRRWHDRQHRQHQ